MSGEIPMPAATPLIERLWGIPTDARLEFGGDNWCSSVPIGVWCEEAANEIERLQAEIADLRVSVIAFGAPAMVEYAYDHGLPKGHLYPSHYDILKRAGARMDSFTRGDER